jgi:organic hydroperoxide reductase OsmC/OhrA
LGGALEARKIPAGDGRLRSHAVGEVEVEDKVLVIKRIHVRYELRVAPDSDRAAIERAHNAHAAHCPVARSIGGCVDITTELRVIDDAES